MTTTTTTKSSTYMSKSDDDDDDDDDDDYDSTSALVRWKRYISDILSFIHSWNMCC